MYNLMRRAAADFDQVLVAFTEQPVAPPAELAEIFTEIVLVHRPGTHDVPDTGRPETVEEFASLAFRAALRETVRKWRPALAQLEFTQMGQYAPDCAPARTVLVEHDITFDLARAASGIAGHPRAAPRTRALAALRDRRVEDRGPRGGDERARPRDGAGRARHCSAQRSGSGSLPAR